MKNTLRSWALAGAVVASLLPLASPDAQESQPAGKPAWQWTVEERLRVRLDPESMAERRRPEVLRAHRWTMPRVPPGLSNKTELAEVIFGERNPELLLPWELFDVLLGTAHSVRDVPPRPDGLPVGRYGQRRGYEITAEQRGLELPPNLWRDLEPIVEPYVDLKRKVWSLAAESQAASGAAQQEMQVRLDAMHAELHCRRAVALARAREHFGAQDFDRFLYVVVAYGLRKWSTEPFTREEHLRFERGCR
jgi:hypothetical protein